MGRQVAAFLTVVVLNLAAAYFLGIAVVAKNYVEFGVSDIVSCESGLLFALVGGLISRKYGFAFAAGAVYLVAWGLAIHFLNAATDGKELSHIFRVNALGMAASVLAAMAGACLGVFLRNRKRSAATR